MSAQTDIDAPFANEPLREFRREPVRANALAALESLAGELPIGVPVLIGGAAQSGEPFDSTDPHAPERAVAHAQAASVEQVDRALDVAARGQLRWSTTPVRERAETLQRAAALLSERRDRLSALAVRECGKPWLEADADVCEAIDFLRYYAREAIALAEPRTLLQMPGERNELRYVPRGITAVVAPWNFPFAIATGMTAAPLAAGNAVVLKPAEQAPACAHAVVTALHEAGVPGDALALLPGADEPGKALVADRRVHQIAFTGSCAAGLAIIEQAAKLVPGQQHLKRVVAEMGGKNVIVVDSDADLDDAIPAILGSAFAFAGQKCSAASRVLVCEPVAAELTERLLGAVGTLSVGDPADFATDVSPVIDAESVARVQRYREVATRDGAAWASQEDVPSDGNYVPPTVVAGLPPDSIVVREEIFGPLLAVDAVSDVAAALAIVDASPFALTGGLFSRSPRTIADVRAHTSVGNLYVNREITGAIVGRQPFGGGRLSGTGPKAGGPDYLLPFVEGKAVTENTVRHGLVV